MRRTLVLCLPLLVAATAGAQPIGTDIAAMNFCLYGDCEARGAYAADPWGWTNPATMPAGTFPYIARGVFASGTYYRVNAGRIGIDVEAPSVTVARAPFVLNVTPIYAEGEGRLRRLPGVDLGVRTRSVRLAAAVDLERAAGVDGLSVGLLGTAPGTATDVRLRAGGLTLARSTDDHEIDLTLGLHWRGGTRTWLMAGAFVNGIRNRSTLDTPGMRTRGTTDLWFARVGLTMAPLIPLGLADGAAPSAEWLGSFRLAADVEHRNLAVPGEGARVENIGYFGADVRLLPDAWNPASRWVRPYAIAGVDTAGGWGAGPGLYGNGPLEFLSCNFATSSRDLIEAIGDRVTSWTANCAVVIPL